MPQGRQGNLKCHCIDNWLFLVLWNAFFPNVYWDLKYKFPSILVTFQWLWHNARTKGTYRRKSLLVVYSFRGKVHDHHSNEHDRRQANIAQTVESSHFVLQVEDRESYLEMVWVSETSKSILWWHSSSSQTIPPILLKWFHQPRTKHTNTWVHRGHFCTIYHIQLLCLRWSDAKVYDFIHFPDFSSEMKF